MEIPDPAPYLNGGGAWTDAGIGRAYSFSCCV